MTEFALYCDDSGHPDNMPDVVVAGFIASESQWLEFEREWRELLNGHNLGPAFHMTDFMSERRSEFKQDWILSQLCGAINKYTLGRFVGAVDMDAYRKINEEYALEECLGAPYSLAARHVTSEVREWQKANMVDGDHLLVFVEQGTKHYGDMEEVFKRDRLPNPVRVPKEVAAVQPGDILGWEALRYLRSGGLSKNLKRLVPKAEFFGGIFRKAELGRIHI